DWLEALIALPEQLFYNTGIATYIWVLTNRKAPARRGKVQLIDASAFWAPMRRSLGDKRREIPPDKAEDIVRILRNFRDGETRCLVKDGKEEEVVVSRVFPNTHFGYRKIIVERPLRINFQASPERITRIEEETAFQNLARSRKKGPAGQREAVEGRAQQEAIRKFLQGLPQTLYKDREEFQALLESEAKKAGVKLSAPLVKAILSALSERDEAAAICRDKSGHPEPDPELRDTENVPLPDGDDPVDAEGVPASVRAFFEREVKPHVPDAWIDTKKRDPKDGKVGIVGYEINFNRYFYRYTPPRPLEEIEADIRAIEQEIMRMLAELTGRKPGEVVR
ncbi:MAG: N-6 DNA methylase, partial [Thermoleophilia bacterium]|nr:N-6 DNA methylase [Thermoleophilia bacterium]